ncbi:hypothetical protein MXB_5413 [Myxobolus squamalis]|nr:hypothetical protein MXB_5413 [Myxobolus squamalis]
MVENKTEQHKKNPIKSVFAGGIAGGLEVLCTFPTEYVKTQLQLDQSSKNPKYLGAINCAKVTVNQYGFIGLYRGLSSLLYGSIPKSAIRFSVYDYCRNARGIKGVYKGIVPTMIKQGSNQAIRFFVFDSLKSLLKNEQDKKIGMAQTFLIGAIAGTASVYGNTPIDVVKTRLQVTKGLESHKYKGTIDCIKKIYHQEGIFAFYKGTLPRLSRVAFDVAFQFTIYEQVMRMLDVIF